MTAEVAILNKSAVAVAADSAVTRGRHKVHISATKIFQLHKTMPIGIVIWNFADVLGLPWELVIKAFREEVHERRFVTLKDACTAFLDFLQSPPFMTEEAQQLDAAQLALDIFNRLAPTYIGRPIKFNEEFSSRMDNFLARNSDGDQHISKMKFARKHGRMCDQICEPDEDAHPRVSKANAKKFKECARHFMAGQQPSGYFSGFAIFGFGERDLLPSLHAYAVDGAPLGKLRILRTQDSAIERNFYRSTSIMAFAQKDASVMFMESIAPQLKKFFFKAIDMSLSGFSDKIFQEVRSLIAKPAELAVAKALIDKEITQFSKRFEEEAEDYIFHNYIRQIVRSLDGLGKADMANLARAMVELASLRQMVSKDVESVGGPIDVAVVSKGDGFIWIDRKYYFDQNMNPAFYNRYFTQRYRLGDEA